METLLGQTISALGWQQGSCIDIDDVIRDAAVAQLGLELDGDGWFAIIVANDCAIVCPVLETEPFVELLLARITTHPDPLAQHGRSSRKLCLGILNIERSGWASAYIYHRIQIDRKCLTVRNPESCTIKLQSSELRPLRHWMAMRYRVETFPDAFNNFLKPHERKLRNLLNRPAAKHIGGLYIDLSPRTEAASYEISVWLLLEQGFNPGDDEEKELDDLKDKFDIFLSQIPGVTRKSDTEWISPEDMTLGNLIRLQRFVLDYISLRSGDLLTDPDP